MTTLPESQEDLRAVRVEVQEFYHRYQQVLDDQLFHDWTELFTQDGEYAVITAENEAGEGLYLLYDEGLDALRERIAFVLGYWQAPRARTLRLLTNLVVEEAGAATVRCTGKFVVFRTDDNGVTSVHTCGRFTDDLVRAESGALRLRRHHVVVQNDVLPGDFTDLL
ncbi:aromatic-ring-hydroxylating dioxygenase subunit beta [Streptomyces sp. NPDC086091]|uniref:aromatic-ring-hydroxylating dioxygenase subunit beta n=1 Tax=unclassified Streptomyces TaxID=2593676 RepID=UPI0037FCB16F